MEGSARRRRGGGGEVGYGEIWSRGVQIEMRCDCHGDDVKMPVKGSVSCGSGPPRWVPFCGVECSGL